MYSADLLSVSLELNQGKWARAQTRRMRRMGNSCVAYCLLLAYGNFFHRHTPPENRSWPLIDEEKQTHFAADFKAEVIKSFNTKIQVL